MLLADSGKNEHQTYLNGSAALLMGSLKLPEADKS
jgi:hypothetical protein